MSDRSERNFIKMSLIIHNLSEAYARHTKHSARHSRQTLLPSIRLRNDSFIILISTACRKTEKVGQVVIGENILRLNVIRKFVGKKIYVNFPSIPYQKTHPPLIVASVERERERERENKNRFRIKKRRKLFQL